MSVRPAADLESETDPEPTYKHPESAPSNGLRREHRSSLIGLIAPGNQKTAGVLSRNRSCYALTS